jgi:hypothetical protein
MEALDGKASPNKDGQITISSVGDYVKKRVQEPLKQSNIMIHVPYVYYGDLLGISTAYECGLDKAKSKLHRFYDEAFHCFSKIKTQDASCNIELFSDSILVSGVDVISFIECMADFYNTLLSYNIMLRGGVVEGIIEYEPKLSCNKSSNRILTQDVLFRASVLQKKCKGARFIIEEKLLNKNEEIGTHFFNTKNKVSGINKSGKNIFEILYPIISGVESCIINKRIGALKEMLASQTDETVKKHFSETILLLQKC